MATHLRRIFLGKLLCFLLNRASYRTLQCLESRKAPCSKSKLHKVSQKPPQPCNSVRIRIIWKGYPDFFSSSASFLSNAPHCFHFPKYPLLHIGRQYEELFKENCKFFLTLQYIFLSFLRWNKQ